jgi:cathepsin L
MAAVLKQPINVQIGIDQGLLDYKGGVYNGSCGKIINHGCLLVGYGTDPVSKLDFWLIRMSWGTKWGENGFLRLFR